jgi:hypothetical protein
MRSHLPKDMTVRPPREFGDNDPSDPEQAGWGDMYESDTQ